MSDVTACLKELPGGFLYVPNSGNAGDSLIAEATYQVLEDTGCRYDVGQLTDVLGESRRTVVVGGGGNLNGVYGNVRQFLNTNFDAFDRLVILPHTIRGEDELLARMDNRFVLFCREVPSYEYCVKAAPSAQVLLADDMALHWDRDRTYKHATAAIRAGLSNPRFSLRQFKHKLRSIQHASKIRNGTLNAFRSDIEAISAQTPRSNVDLSGVFATDAMTRDYAASAVQFLADYLDKTKNVRTDRLHIAILSALLGKSVDMYDNNYGKNLSVYEHSLAGRFPNITFHKQS
ncbi:MAG: polysaccharide pyruvyl transferase family protein [Erythrobacter sp.]